MTISAEKASGGSVYGRKMYVLSLPLYSGAFANQTSLREISLAESSISRSLANGPLVSRLGCT